MPRLRANIRCYDKVIFLPHDAATSVSRYFQYTSYFDYMRRRR